MSLLFFCGPSQQFPQLFYSSQGEHFLLMQPTIPVTHCIINSDLLQSDPFIGDQSVWLQSKELLCYFCILCFDYSTELKNNIGNSRVCDWFKVLNHKVWMSVIAHKCYITYVWMGLIWVASVLSLSTSVANIHFILTLLCDVSIQRFLWHVFLHSNCKYFIAAWSLEHYLELCGVWWTHFQQMGRSRIYGF